MDQMGALEGADIARMCVECRTVTTSTVLDAIYKATRGQDGPPWPHYILCKKKKEKAPT